MNKPDIELIGDLRINNTGEEFYLLKINLEYELGEIPNEYKEIIKTKTLEIFGPVLRTISSYTGCEETIPDWLFEYDYYYIPKEEINEVPFQNKANSFSSLPKYIGKYDPGELDPQGNKEYHVYPAQKDAEELNGFVVRKLPPTLKNV